MAFLTTRLPGFADCTNQLYQAYLAGRHCISEDEFNRLTSNFNSTPLEGKCFTRANIDTILSNHACATYYLEIGTDDPDTGLPNSNSDIKINVVEHGHRSKNQVFSVLKTKAYSIELFQGIVEVFDPTLICFFKGMQVAGGTVDDFEIAFKAYRDDDVVYIGDISGLP